MEPQHITKKPKLTDLPNETIITIFSYLPRDGRLTSVALMSHRFHDLVKEFLFHTISLNVDCSIGEVWEAYGVKGAACGYRPAKGILDLERFSRLIDSFSSRPELERCVKDLKLHPLLRCIHYVVFILPVSIFPTSAVMLIRGVSYAGS